MQHLRFEGEAVASVGVAHPPRTRRWLGAAASALETDLYVLPHYAESFTKARRVRRSRFLEHRQHHFLRQTTDLVASRAGGLDDGFQSRVFLNERAQPKSAFVGFRVWKRL